MFVDVEIIRSGEKNINNLVLFSDENFKIKTFNKNYIGKNGNNILNTLNNRKDKEKNFINFDVSANQKIIIIKLKKNFSSLEIEKLGAEFFNYLKLNSFLNLLMYEFNISDYNKLIRIF